MTRSNGMILEWTGPGVREGYEILMRTSLAEGGEAAVWHELCDVGIKVGSVITDWKTREVERRELRLAARISGGLWVKMMYPTGDLRSEPMEGIFDTRGTWY